MSKGKTSIKKSDVNFFEVLEHDIFLKNRKDNKIDALKEQLDKSKDDQALLAKWIAAREKNNQAKLEKKIIDEQREIYSERIAKLKEKSDLEIKSIKANIAEKQAQKKALDLIS